MSRNFYLTTTLPYVNADPHIGFALEIVQADTIARFKKLVGFDVFFNFGTDEHGLKIYRKAIEAGKDPKAYVDEYAEKFDNLKKALNLSYNNFIRTTEEFHKKAAQEFWQRSLAAGDIYKKLYKIKYCVGCELEKTDSELEGGKCPIHPNLDLEIIEEENYFFRFSKYQDKLLSLFRESKEFVIPSFRQKEIEEFVKGGLTDFSISRLKSKLPWGVEVPGDSEQVMYVWFDALINYISAIGWPTDLEKFEKWWPVTQFAGKDNLRQQSAIWQAMLMSGGLPPSKQIFIHGFITANGQKISKSLGNVVDPYELVKNYGTDAVRYFLLARIHPFEDSDFTYEKFETSYNADLANGLGNLVARIAKLAEVNKVDAGKTQAKKLDKLVKEPLEQFRFDLALEEIWKKIKVLDTKINDKELWKETYKKVAILVEVIEGIRQIAFDLKPFLPETAEKIETQFKSPTIKSEEPLFPRIA